MAEVYYIGGAPCSGKSTIAERISVAYGFQYFRADDHLWKFINDEASNGNEFMKYIQRNSFERLFEKPAQELFEQETFLMESFFQNFIDEIEQIREGKNIIADSTAFLPSQIKNIGVKNNRYVCMNATSEFQKEHTIKRLNGHEIHSRPDGEKGVDTWIAVLNLTALYILKQIEETDYPLLTVDGSKSIDENYQFVIEAFEL